MRFRPILLALALLAGCSDQGTVESHQLSDLTVGQTTSTELTSRRPCASGPIRHRVRLPRRGGAGPRIAVGISRSELVGVGRRSASSWTGLRDLTVILLLLPSQLRLALCQRRVPLARAVLIHKSFELSSTLFIVLEHVVARARR